MENPENPYFSLRENENLIDIYEERNSDTITQNDQKIKENPLFLKYIKACDKSIFLQIALLIISTFKIAIASTIIFTNNEDKLVVLWLKIAFFYEVLECLHIFFVIRYLKNKQENIKKSFFSFLKNSEVKFYYTKEEIFALDVLIEANSSLKFSNIFNILNKLFYVIIFCWGNYIFISVNGFEKSNNDADVVMFLLLFIPGYVVIIFVALLIILSIIAIFLFIIIKIISKIQKYIKRRLKEQRNLEILKKLKENFFNINNETNSNSCPICLNVFENENDIIQLPCNQRHLFHYKCLEQWIKRKVSCPICREKLK